MKLVKGIAIGAMALALAACDQSAYGGGGGMIVGTALAVFFVPLFFVVVRSVFKATAHEQARAAEHALDAGITAEAAQQYVADAESELSDAERRALGKGNDNGNTGSAPTSREPS